MSKPAPIIARSMRREGSLRFCGVPISMRMGPRYLTASRVVVRVINAGAATLDDLPYISEAKGMYNRVVRHDRPDWEAVRALLGEPDRAICHLAATWLAELRNRVKEGESLCDHLARPLAGGVRAALHAASLALERAGYDR